jgi:hypothetical protein
MLVHMTPEEVQSLQALALKNGGSLTINPDTGLPEANFLKKLLPIALGAFLGPAGAAIGGGFMSAGMAGLTVGGLTTLATGSLSRGLMAGLGAYGGAGLAESLTSAGTGALAAGDIAAQQAAGTFPVAPELAGMTAEQAAAATNSYASQVSGVRDMALSKAGEAGFGAKAAAGFGQVASNPGAYAKDALQYGLAAISPIMADQGVQTATKRPDTGTIRNYTFDPYGQTYTSAGNYPASEYKGMAQGGIVALAAGGPSYIDLSRDSSADQIASAYKAFTDASGGNTQQNQAAAIDYLTNLGIGQDKINQAYGKYTAGPTYTNYTQQNVLDYLQANPTVDIAAATAQTGADPRTVAQAINSLGAGYLDPTNTTGGSGAFQYYDAYTNKGIGAKELYDAKLLLDPNYSFDAQTGAAGLAAMQRAFDVAKQFDTYRYGTVGNTTLEKDIDFLKNYDAGKFTGDRTQQIEDIARETGLSLSEATRRYDAARAGMVTPPPPPPPTVCPTGFHYDPVAKACVPNISATQNTTTTVTTPTDIATAASTALPVGISGAGVTTINPNGTVTTAPNIPGRPEGGFTGMGQVRDAYTAGGGSLGYVNRAPKTIDEFNERFNKQTGDSLNAYNYLMGKGANNNAYPTKSGVAQIMRPYSEVTTGVPVAEGRPTQKYIFQGGKYVENPNYQPLSYNSKGERKVGMTTSEVLKGVQGLKDPADDGALFDWATANNISEAQLAAALGISIAEARARIAAGKTKSTGNTGNTGNTNNTDTLNDYEKLQMQSPGSANGGVIRMALGGLGALAGGGSTAQYNLGGYSDGGRLLRGPGDGVSDSIPATIGNKQPARLADGEFVIPARIVSELGNGSTEAGARKLYAMMDRVQKARGKTTGKSRVAANTRSEKYLPA